MSQSTAQRQLIALFVLLAASTAATIQREGWETTAYPDPVMGKKLPSACGGLTEGIVLGRTYTEDECVMMQALAMVKHTAPIMPCFPNGGPPEALKEFSSMALNIGAGGFRGSSMCKLSKAGDFKGACDAMLQWYWSDGHDCRTDRKCRGLWIDRQASHKRCLEALA